MTAGGKVLFRDFIKGITIDEPSDEIRSIGYLIFEKVLNLSKTDIMSDKFFQLSPENETTLSEITNRINNQEPVQYILEEAEFFGRKFYVNPAVLIPRPETEELVRLILSATTACTKILHVLDIGTGSGCIPITIKLQYPEAVVFATDISKAALEVARENAQRLNAEITLLNHDILQEEIPFQKLDIVVSNPPYITIKEKAAMKKNVTEYEPHTALFVPDDDPLIFYKAIAANAKRILNSGGLLIVEINEHYGLATRQLLERLDFHNLTIHKDISNKDRFVSGYAR